MTESTAAQEPIRVVLQLIESLLDKDGLTRSGLLHVNRLLLDQDLTIGLGVAGYHDWQMELLRRVDAYVPVEDR